ncbi:Bacterial regulatory helix-turn-helix protein, lysR family [Legionella beliardensis]|uniref:Bacterial regulatory helix-turn-helix protein, lysR family n=1 Tax=Legionella beliardensis TaxID=91822 RepID=A0A378JP84_9GAMM|nr:hypothetical protein [Legionella beliardensis]STX55593.1 Bacterial regulatory helix-turn-helix protein, lysR family [Legionella beliardensis]
MQENFSKLELISFCKIHKAIRETNSIKNAALKLNVDPNILSDYIREIAKKNFGLAYQKLRTFKEQELEHYLGPIYRKCWIIHENGINYENEPLYSTTQPLSVLTQNYTDVVDILDHFIDTYTSASVIGNSHEDKGNNESTKLPQEYPFNEIHKAIKNTPSVSKAALKLNVAYSTLSDYLKKIAKINPDLTHKNLQTYKENELVHNLGFKYRQCWIIHKNAITYANTELQITHQSSSTVAYNHTDVDGTLDQLMATYTVDNSNNKPRKYPRECAFNEIHKAIIKSSSLDQAALDLNVAYSTLADYLKKIAKINPDLTYKNLKKYEEYELENQLGPKYRQCWIIHRNTITYKNPDLHTTTLPSAILNEDHIDVNDTLDQFLNDYALPFTSTDESLKDTVVQTDNLVNVVENLSELMNIYELLPPIVDDNEELDSLLEGLQNFEEDSVSSLSHSVTTSYANNQTNKRLIEQGMTNHIDSNLLQEVAVCPTSLPDQRIPDSADEHPEKRVRLSVLATHSLFNNSQLSSDEKKNSNCKQIEKASRSNNHS